MCFRAEEEDGDPDFAGGGPQLPQATWGHLNHSFSATPKAPNAARAASGVGKRLTGWDFAHFHIFSSARTKLENLGQGFSSFLLHLVLFLHPGSTAAQHRVRGRNKTQSAAIPLSKPAFLKAIQELKGAWTSSWGLGGKASPRLSTSGCSTPGWHEGFWGDAAEGQALSDAGRRWPGRGGGQ